MANTCGLQISGVATVSRQLVEAGKRNHVTW